MRQTNIIGSASSSKLLAELLAEQRWALAKHLQCEMDAGNAALSCSDHFLAVRRLRSLEHGFDAAFPCPAALVAFWGEVRTLSWADQTRQSPWPDLLAMGADLVEYGTLSPLDGGRQMTPAVRHLREHADAAWPADSAGLSYVIQQESGQDDGGLWTSTPMWDRGLGDVMNGVRAGWISGASRWAVSIGVRGEEPKFLAGLDRRGMVLREQAVRSIIDATIKSFDLPRQDSSRPARTSALEAVFERPRRPA